MVLCIVNFLKMSIQKNNHELIKPVGEVRIGHINLKVANLNRSLAFYSEILGFKITKQIGDEAAFLAYGGYHHDICLNTWHSKNGSIPEKGTTGLFHLAILFAERSEMIKVYQRLKEAGITITSVVDHAVNESIYLDDPDGNGVELYWDRPEEFWWDENGNLKMSYQSVDPEIFLK
jgi:catechol 2,3-dioxygenase